MVLPIGDAPHPRGGVPFVTYALIAANVAVFVLVTVPLAGDRPSLDDSRLREYVRAVSSALDGRVPLDVVLRQATSYDLFLFAHGFRPVRPSLADLFASMFLHGGLLHLAGNMLFLWIYGANVERRLGWLRYALTYLGTGAAALAVHWASAPGSPLPVVGASGAICGILGCYVIWFPRNVVRLLWLVPPCIGQVVEMRARVVIGVYLVANTVLPYLLGASRGGVAHGVHVGGFVAGVMAASLAHRSCEYGGRERIPPAAPASPAAAPRSRVPPNAAF